MKKLLFSMLVLNLVFAGTSHAALALTDLKWQKSLNDKSGPKIKFIDAQEVEFKQEDKNYEKLRVVLNVSNLNGKPAEGIVLRCAFYMRIVKAGDKKDEGVWAVPFWLEERRVSKVNPGIPVSVVISHIDLRSTLLRLKETGFWVNALKVEVMAEPRAGDDISKNMVQCVLPVKSGQ